MHPKLQHIHRVYWPTICEKYPHERYFIIYPFDFDPGRNEHEVKANSRKHLEQFGILEQNIIRGDFMQFRSRADTYVVLIACSDDYAMMQLRFEGAAVYEICNNRNDLS